MLYYSHSMKIYGTRREKKEVKLISEHFPRIPIYNPNNKTIRTAVFPMEWCLRQIESDETIGVIFSTYLDHVGKGVYTEVKRAVELNKPIHVIKRNKILPFVGQYLNVVDADDWIIRYAEVVGGGD